MKNYSYSWNKILSAEEITFATWHKAEVAGLQRSEVKLAPMKYRYEFTEWRRLLLAS